MSEINEIRNRLFAMADEEYRDFQSALIPADKNTDIKMIGIRTPALRSFAKELYKTGGFEAFLTHLPHEYFDENQLHAFLISLIRDYDACMARVNAFLPYVDNWATCDQLRPVCFGKNKERLLGEIHRWLKSEHPYTVRFAVGMLMAHYLDDAFMEEYFDLVSGISSEEYYVNMMRAWYFATALAKQYEYAVKVIEQRKLDPWTHNKTIQKACESYRLNKEQKEYLKTMKIQNNKKKG